MAILVVVTKYLRQRGSSGSKKFDAREAVDEDPRKHRNDPDAPWPVRLGGWILVLYERSLSLALAGLFVLSFALHALGGARAESMDAEFYGKPGVSWFRATG